jgi:hypothetical protein
MLNGFILLRSNMFISIYSNFIFVYYCLLVLSIYTYAFLSSTLKKLVLFSVNKIDAHIVFIYTT